MSLWYKLKYACSVVMGCIIQQRSIFFWRLKNSDWSKVTQNLKYTGRKEWSGRICLYTIWCLWGCRHVVHLIRGTGEQRELREQADSAGWQRMHIEFLAIMWLTPLSKLMWIKPHAGVCVCVRAHLCTSVCAFERVYMVNGNWEERKETKPYNTA